MGALLEEPGSTLRNADASTTPGLRQSMFGLNWELELILWRDPVGDALSKKKKTPIRHPRDMASRARPAEMHFTAACAQPPVPTYSYTFEQPPTALLASVQ